MADEKNIDYDGLKKRGFLRQRQEGFFVLRTRMSSGVYKKEHLEKILEISGKYGRGFVHATTRQGLEIPFIKYDAIPQVEKELNDTGVNFGTSGPRLRTTTVCPGNNWCKAGLIDTFSLEAKIEKELGIKCGADLPHKFKIAISGCPNSCTRPQFSDMGIHGQIDLSSPDKHTGYAIYVGGLGGRISKAGFKLEKIFTEKEALLLIEKTVKFYKRRGKPRQRLGSLIDEIGKNVFIEEVVV